MEPPDSRDSRKLILVVDDHKDTCSVVERLLRSAGLLAECITSPLEALERLQTVTPAAMLLDIMMPEMSGIELLSNEADLQEASRLGAREIIPKARFDWSRLPEHVRPYLV